LLVRLPRPPVAPRRRPPTGKDRILYKNGWFFA